MGNRDHGFTSRNAVPFVVLLTMAGTLSLAFCVFFFQAERPYETERIAATAEVVEKYIRKETVQGAIRSHYTVRYHYNDESGQAREGSDEVHRDDWNRLVTGSTLPVLYLRSRPDQNRSALANASRYRWPLGLLAAFGSTLLARAAALGWSTFARRIRDTSAFRPGR